MQAKAIFNVIVRDALRTKFMQATDVFDAGKIVGEIKTFTATFKEFEQVTFERCQNLINMWAKTPKNFPFVLIHLHSIENEDQILLNTKLKCMPYIDYSVRQISDGQHTFFLKDYLVNELGISVETDQFVFVKPLSPIVQS